MDYQPYIDRLKREKANAPSSWRPNDDARCKQHKNLRLCLKKISELKKYFRLARACKKSFFTSGPTSISECRDWIGKIHLRRCLR